MKKTAIFLGVIVFLFSVSGCVSNDKLVIWSFSDDLGKMINDYYLPKHDGVKLDYSFISAEQFNDRLEPVFVSRREVPDVFTLDAVSVQKYAEMGKLLDLTGIYERNKEKLLVYPVEIGTYNNRVYGLPLQVTPGAFFYRRSLARKYFGTDNPVIIQNHFNNIETFMQAAQILRRRSNGNCVIITSRDDFFPLMLAAREQPWIVNGRLVIDDKMVQYMDIAKTMYENRLEGSVDHRSNDWLNGMKGELKNEAGNPVEVFGYFLSVYDFKNTLKKINPDSIGEWAMIQGPVPYQSGGGIWISAHAGTKNSEVALQLIEWLTTNNVFLKDWVNDTGNISGNLEIINDIYDNFFDPFLAGQNYYTEFIKIAKNINGNLIQSTDRVIENAFQEAVAAYVRGEKNKDRALADFRNQVTALLGL
jgi:ABC-type glycerol-3-phosphate transport system substrate-binding protein